MNVELKCSWSATFMVHCPMTSDSFCQRGSLPGTCLCIKLEEAKSAHIITGTHGLRLLTQRATKAVLISSASPPLILGGNIHTLAICTIKSQQSHLYLLLFHFNQPLCKPLKTLSSNRPHADSWASKGGKGSGGNPTTERRNDRLHYVFQISLKKCMKLS